MYETIIENIRDGLSGDKEKDIEYLKEQAFKYKDHAMGNEIVKECGRMLFDLLESEEKNAFGKALEKDFERFYASLDEVKKQVYKGNYNVAYVLSSELVNDIDKISLSLYENDRANEYYSFSEPFEKLIYDVYSNKQKEIHDVEIPFSTVYLIHGSILFELERFEEAKSALEKAIKWNPASATAAFEYTEVLKNEGDWENFARVTRDMHKYLFRSQDVARYYRNLGFYFTEKHCYKVAIGCYFMSLQYDDSELAKKELFYIKLKTRAMFRVPSLKRLEKYSQKYDFEIGVSETVLDLAKTYGEHFIKEKQKDGAIYFFEIIDDLTESKRTGKIIDEIRDM